MQCDVDRSLLQSIAIVVEDPGEESQPANKSMKRRFAGFSLRSSSFIAAYLGR
jgi:hypothetical protein